MLNRVIPAAALLLAAAGPVAAQGTTALVLRPESRLSFSGTSTLHPFTCSTSEMTARITVDSAFRKGALGELKTAVKSLEVTIPVKSLKCGHDKMDDNMYKTLKAGEFQTITYTLTASELIPIAASADSFSVKATGKLALVGNERPIELEVAGARTSEGGARAHGATSIKMSELGIKPPSFMLGTLKVGDKVDIKFDLVMSHAAAVALAP